MDMIHQAWLLLMTYDEVNFGERFVGQVNGHLIHFGLTLNTSDTR
jgi:hypothetical protein